MVDGDDGLLDSSSDHLVIAEATVLESNNGTCYILLPWR